MSVVLQGGNVDESITSFVCCFTRRNVEESITLFVCCLTKRNVEESITLFVCCLTRGNVEESITSFVWCFTRRECWWVYNIICLMFYKGECAREIYGSTFPILFNYFTISSPPPSPQDNPLTLHAPPTTQQYFIYFFYFYQIAKYF